MSHRKCCIKGCLNTTINTKHISPPITFYSFPLVSKFTPWKAKKRQLWINAIKNYTKYKKNWKPSINARICSSHFIGNAKAEHPDHPSYLPTIFPGTPGNNTNDVNYSAEKIKSDVKMESCNKEISTMNDIKIEMCNVGCPTTFLEDSDGSYVVNWTTEEKIILLKGLQKYGPNAKSISKHISTKTVNDVIKAIAKYKDLASKSNIEDKPSEGAPCDLWIDVINKNYDSTAINPMARAMKYIALFETRQKFAIDIRKCYTSLEYLALGILPEDMNDLTTHFFYECFSKVAQNVKENKYEEIKQFLQNFEASTTTKTDELENVLNPLQIPPHLLKINENNNICDYYTNLTHMDEN